MNEPITPEKLNGIISNHGKWLRGEVGGVRADLADANLTGANLTGAEIPPTANITGEEWSDYLANVVPALLTAGGKTLEHIVASGCWECHDWSNCPMHEAFGINSAEKGPLLLRPRIKQFVQLFDASLIPCPAIENEVPLWRDDAAWQSAPIGELKLKPALATKLAEHGIETIGQLEDLRAGAGLRSLKGVGQAKADAIEDAVLAWLSANRDAAVFKGKDFCGAPIGYPECGNDSHVFTAANIEAETPIARGPVLEGECTHCGEHGNWCRCDEESPLSTTTPAGIAANDSDAQRAAAIEDRASDLLHQQRSAEEAGDGVEPLEPQCGEDRYWNAGVEAFDRGTPVRDCPWEGDAMDDWIRGWLTAKLAEVTG